MYKKWLGWKKVAVCLVGAAMIMQGGSLAMAADEYPTEQDGPDYAEDDQTSEDTTEDTDEDTLMRIQMKMILMQIRMQKMQILMKIPTALLM